MNLKAIFASFEQKLVKYPFFSPPGSSKFGFPPFPDLVSD